MRLVATTVKHHVAIYALLNVAQLFLLRHIEHRFTDSSFY